MPWWVIVYLAVLTLIITIELVRDVRGHRGCAYIAAELVSGISGWLFIFAYFHAATATLLSWSVIPLLLYVISWDQYALSQIKKSAYADLSEHENRDMDKFSKLFAFLFISPCYIAGAMLSWQFIHS